MSSANWNRKLTIKDFLQIVLVIGFVILVVNVALDQQESENTFNMSDQTVTQTISQPVYDLSQAHYELVKEEDLSLSSANRFQLKVLITDNPVTEAEIKAISEKLVVDYQEKADALSILYYFDEAQVDGAYTLAMAEWAPNGNWGDADLKSNQILIYSLKDIVVK